MDQFTKYLAVTFLKDQPAIPIIKEVFELKYLENTSAAFGMDPVSLLHNIFQFAIFLENPQLYLNVRMTFFYIFTIAMIFLFAWNEWGEGGYLEPDEVEEYKRLEAVREALIRCNEFENWSEGRGK